jgi:hypothetical protein
MTRRAVYAFVALADAPEPRVIAFPETDGGSLQLTMDSWGDMSRWVALLGIVDEPYTASYATGNSTTIMSGQWGGWRVILNIFGPTEQIVDHLDEETRTRLEALLPKCVAHVYTDSIDFAHDYHRCNLAEGHESTRHVCECGYEWIGGEPS